MGAGWGTATIALVATSRQGRTLDTRRYTLASWILVTAVPLLTGNIRPFEGRADAAIQPNIPLPAFGFQLESQLLKWPQCDRHEVMKL